MTPKVQRTIELVHRLDLLRKQREDMLRQVDAHIERILQELQVLTDGGDVKPDVVMTGKDGLVTIHVQGKAVSSMTMQERIQHRAALEAGRAGLNVSDQILATLQKNPNADLRSIAIAVYGHDSAPARNRLSSALNTLLKAGKVRRVAHGRWEAVLGGPINETVARVTALQEEARKQLNRFIPGDPHAADDDEDEDNPHGVEPEH